VAAVYQRQLSMPSMYCMVNEYQQKLGSKRAYHALVHGLVASAKG